MGAQGAGAANADAGQAAIVAGAAQPASPPPVDSTAT